MLYLFIHLNIFSPRNTFCRRAHKKEEKECYSEEEYELGELGFGKQQTKSRQFARFSLVWSIFAMRNIFVRELS